MEIAGMIVISSLLRVGTDCIAVHEEGDVAIWAVHRRDMKPPGHDDRLGEGHLRLMIALEFYIDHLIWRRRWNVDAGARERHEDKLGDLVSVVFKWNHESGDGDEFIIKSACGRARLRRIESLERGPADGDWRGRGSTEKQSTRKCHNDNGRDPLHRFP